MSKSNTPQRRLGPYVLGPRYKHTEDLGRVYRARNAETGAPALVLEHTERQVFDVPGADWTLRLRSSESPAYLALEVESAPQSSEAEVAAEELDFMLEDLHLVVTRTLRTPVTLRHLRSPHVPEARPEPPPVLVWPRRVLGGALAACVALLMLQARSSATAENESARPELATARWDAGWDGEGDVTGAALTGLADFEPLVLARPMPKKPFGVQKRAPCDKDIEAEVFGGCWVATDKAAPCPDKLYEHAGKCYLPAVKAPPPPTSIWR